MPALSGEQQQGPGRGLGHRRLIEALSSPDSYGLVVLLILITYGLSASLTGVMGGVASTGRADGHGVGDAAGVPGAPAVRVLANVALAAAALAAVANIFFRDQLDGHLVAAWVSCLLYLIAPVSIVRHLVVRRVVDSETVLGAIAAYLMAGMFFAFFYHALGLSQTHMPFFGPQGRGTLSQDLFFSFTTLTTTGYGNLVPAGNPGQTLAVLEMLIGQLFLVTAVAKVVSAWRPGQGRGGLREDSDGQ